MAKSKQSAASLMQRPAGAGALLGIAAQFMQRGMLGQARAQCQQVLRTAPANADAHYLLGLIAARAGDFDEASKHLEESLKLNPASPAAHNNLGVALRKRDQHEAAIGHFEAAATLKPDYPEAHHNLGNSLRDLGRMAEALASYDRAIALKPGHAASHSGRGNALVALRRFEEAVDCFTRAIAADGSSADTFSNRGGALVELGRYEEAFADLDRAIALDSRHLEAYESRAQASTGAKRHAEAVAFYQRLHDLDPAYPFVKGNLLHARMLCGDWTGIDSLAASIRSDLAAGLPAAEPFGYQGVCESEKSLLDCARIFAAREYPPEPMAPLAAIPAAAQADRRITIGYVCGEFRQHATTILMCGVYEAHDRSRYRLIGFDNGIADASDYRRRVEIAFDEMVPIARLGDREAAEVIRSMGVDILVNLNGYFGKERTGVFACRAAPIQVNYLGFPGTMGSAYFDYLVADDVVIPLESREFYVEKVAYLPHCYQANDSKRKIAGPAAGRAGSGLPADAFIFCCFNNNYKITPATFDAWMRILTRVEGSCLWLLENNPEVARNLRRAAQDRGIASERLIFAVHVAPDEHLARHALADLFLDTWPYNAHTTGSDALWAGLPVLTLTGQTMPGRVGTSLLRGLDLPELVAPDVKDYEAIAIRLATEPARLAAIRERLRVNRLEEPLFDTALFTQQLEAAYQVMFDRNASGLPPTHFHVPADAQGEERK